MKRQKQFLELFCFCEDIRKNVTVTVKSINDYADTLSAYSTTTLTLRKLFDFVKSKKLTKTETSNDFLTLQSNISEKTENFAKPFMPFHMVLRSNLLSQKMVENLATLSL